MRVWVVGAGGMVGSCLLAALLKRGIAAVGSKAREADVTDPASLEKFWEANGPFTHLVNCAAYTQVDLAETDARVAFAVNSEGPAHVGRLAKRWGSRVIHLSTDYVFNGKKREAYREEESPDPINVYGMSKWRGEEHLREIFPGACIVRTSALFGPGGRNFVDTMIRKMRLGEALRVVDDQITRPTYTRDLVDQLIALLPFSGTYHVANREEMSWFAFASWIACEMGIEVSILPVTSQEYQTFAKRPAYSVLDTTRMERAIGPLRSARDALHAYIQEFHAVQTPAF